MEVGGISAGGLFVNSSGVAHIVTRIGQMGVIWYRRHDDGNAREQVLDVVRFIRRFTPLPDRRAALVSDAA